MGMRHEANCAGMIIIKKSLQQYANKRFLHAVGKGRNQDCKALLSASRRTGSEFECLMSTPL